MPRDVRKAIVASGLVHDLGKALIPQVVFKAPNFEATHRRALVVFLLMARLLPANGCLLRWRKRSLGDQRRLDGSGYPAGITDDINGWRSLQWLTLLRRCGEIARSPTGRSKFCHLLAHPHQFDRHWMRRYANISKVCRWGR